MEIKLIKRKMWIGSWCYTCNKPIEDEEVCYLLTEEERRKTVFEEKRYGDIDICSNCFKSGIKFKTHSKSEMKDDKLIITKSKDGRATNFKW